MKFRHAPVQEDRILPMGKPGSASPFGDPPGTGLDFPSAEPVIIMNDINVCVE
jgi:hypothetical protein